MTGILGEPPLPAPRNEREFVAFMEAMDRRFADYQIGIPARQMGAIPEVMRAYNLDEMIVPTSGSPVPGSFGPRDVLLRALAWFDERYGDAQKTYMGPGYGLVVLKGAAWLTKYPTIFGRAAFFTKDRPDGLHLVQGTAGYDAVAPDGSIWQDPTLPKYDIFSYVQGLPDSVIPTLGTHEVKGLAYVFCRNRLFLGAMIRARQRKFIEEARTDLEAAAHMLVPPTGTPGLAQWACLQAVEKSLKAYLHAAGKKYPTRGAKGHDLTVLAGLVADAGGPAFPEDLILRVQCSSRVRYERGAVTPQSAVAAHFAAVEIAGVTAAHLMARFGSAEV